VKEKERKLLLLKAASIKKEPPKKSIDFLVAVHKMQREGLVEEIFEDLLGEYNNLL
jgi:hypothetical protein